VRLDRVTISGNPDGIEIGGGSAEVYNSFVVTNGSQFSAARGIFASGGTLLISYSTIASNDGTDPGSAVSCFGGSTTIRNSIILAGAGTSTAVNCPGLVLDYSGVDDVSLGVGTNTSVGAFQPGWFVSAGTDYHLSATNPFADLAQWQAGEPTTDFDGDVRPTVTTSHPGADEP
jgi:hypothetical protein